MKPLTDFQQAHVAKVFPETQEEMAQRLRDGNDVFIGRQDFAPELPPFAIFALDDPEFTFECCDTESEAIALAKQLGLVVIPKEQVTVEQWISGNLFFEAEKGAKDGGCYSVAVNRFQRIAISTSCLTPDDLRAMADHLEAQRKNLAPTTNSNDELTPEQKTTDALRSPIRALPTGTKTSLIKGTR